MQLKRVVVTGIGALTPVGNNLHDYWNGLINGVSGADFITSFDASKFKTRFACELKNFDPLAFLEKKKRANLIVFLKLLLLPATKPLPMPALPKKILTMKELAL